MAKLSVVTACFNQERTIEQTINSVLSQDFPELEYIIMDGGSTDGTVEIIEKHKKDIDVLSSKKDKGQYHAISEMSNLDRC